MSWRRFWEPPSLLEGDERPAGGDLLAEERERRQRRRRGFRAVWPGFWLTGGTGLAILVVFLVSGLGWLGFRQWDQFDFPLGRADRPAPPAEAVTSGPEPPERLRDLTAAEHAQAARFGSPLYLGAGGSPVVAVAATGTVRELTPFELELESPVSYRSTRRGLVVQTAGPRGWGLWWRDTAELDSLAPLLSFDRRAWRDRQEAELNRTLRGIYLGFFVLNSLDYAQWERGLGEPLLSTMARVKEPYPPAGWGLWSGVPGRWVCDAALERQLAQGVGPGCPGREYREALGDAWFAFARRLGRELRDGAGPVVNLWATFTLRRRARRRPTQWAARWRWGWRRWARARNCWSTLQWAAGGGRWWWSGYAEGAPGNRARRGGWTGAFSGGRCGRLRRC